MNENKFTGLSETYAKFRPKYPQAFIEYLYSDVGVKTDSIIADVGAGTGILTKQLLESGNKVYAVEPNEDMRSIAETDLNVFDNYYSVKGTAENTTLDDSSVDFITVAQAFHWFDEMKFKKECGRILKANGKVILVWNSRSLSSDVVKDSDAVTRKYCPNFEGFSGGMRGTEDHDTHYGNFYEGDYISKVFQNDITFDLEGFIGRSRSASYTLRENDENFDAYIKELTECFYRYAVDGKMVMANETRSYVGVV